MKLMSSFAISGVVVVSIWGVAMMQFPLMAATEHSDKPDVQVEAPNLATKQPSLRPNTTEAVKGVRINTMSISGVQQKIAIKHIAKLWETFENQQALNKNLLRYPRKISVYYQNFSQDFQQAEISIGYLSDIVRSANQSTTIQGGRYERVLQKAAHSNEELADAWKKIDYRKNLQSVLEIHYLDASGHPVSSEFMVNYK
ncbi:hypothetical protein [Pseudoalteromonas obscura]|uniref:Uncharacterized protein n=1 Tax=Pseudoalteromonas obscura TaxID=3048491 RepID=A0ABT7ENH6_9GAMM|nr:hypothetical protein [Pseudoalteromonas sp. P94(2023)]MDK2596606.1 hypothetical protein [Pseudoalteromonas sp. P94(2023)]